MGDWGAGACLKVELWRVVNVGDGLWTLDFGLCFASLCSVSLQVLLQVLLRVRQYRIYALTSGF